MKFKNLVFLLPVLILFACNNTGSQGDKVADSIPIVDHTEHSEPTKVLSLNNGEKWQSDESTNNHVKDLSAIFGAFGEKSRSGLADYQLLASEAQTELNGLIKDCKMTGPDHDALHLWLEPILKSTVELKDAKSMEEAEVISGVIIKEIDKFSTYFK